MEPWELPQHLPIPTEPPSLSRMGGPGIRAFVGGGQGEQGLLGRGDGAASPVFADGLSLHLDSIELPRTILEHGGVDSVLEETPPLPGPTRQPGGPCWRRQGSRIEVTSSGITHPVPSAHCSDGKAEVQGGEAPVLGPTECQRPGWAENPSILRPATLSHRHPSPAPGSPLLPCLSPLCLLFR